MIPFCSCVQQKIWDTLGSKGEGHCAAGPHARNDGLPRLYALAWLPMSSRFTMVVLGCASGAGCRPEGQLRRRSATKHRAGCLESWTSNGGVGASLRVIRK